MNTIAQKLTSDYWIKKTKNSSLIAEETFVPANTKRIQISNEELVYFLKITAQNPIAEYTILFAIYNVLTQRYFETSDFIFSTKLGEAETPLLLKQHGISGKSLKTILQETKAEIQETYKYTEFGANFELKNQFKNYTTFGLSYEETSYNLPFTLHVAKQNDGLQIWVSFSTDFTKEGIAAHFLENMKQWIVNLEQNIAEKVTIISIISEEEQQRIVTEFNNTTLPFPLEETIVDLFEKQAAKTPNNIAIVVGERSFTYEEVNKEANRLANYLIQEYQINIDDFIGVKLERDEKLVISLLAVLKTGAAYVPIDKNYPQERIEYIEKDSNCRLVIDENLPYFHSTETTYDDANVGVDKDADELAYIIYTSGTTGNPKGVMITHRNAVAMIYWAFEEFQNTRYDIVYAVTSHCFDLSVYELFYTLSTGKKIRVLQNALEIPYFIEKDQNILINTVPSSMRNLLAKECSLENVVAINLAGEPFPVDIANRLLAETSAEIRNLYGPSEDTTYSTYYQLSEENDYSTIPVGKPLLNTQAYILDENCQLVPVGVEGRLYLAGLGVTKGYLKRPELTGEKYITNPFNTAERMYDTGDQAKWMPDGNIAFLGRKDHQVKLRGFRIELEEIETAIQRSSEAIQQVVTIVKTHLNEEVLVAYYTATQEVDKVELRATLTSKLPSYMLPSYFIALPKIPLTPNGKLNRKALPEIDASKVVKENYIAPTNQTEETLVKIWEDILGVEEIGIKDHFFELGGHSLMISQMINRVHKEMDKRIPFKIFYTNPTVESLSQSLLDETFTKIEAAPEAEAYDLSPSQTRFWLLQKIQGKSKEFNIYNAFKMQDDLDHSMFEEAFNIFIDRHEILRTIFIEEEGLPKQKIQKFVPVVVPFYEVENVETIKETIFDHAFDFDEETLYEIAIAKDATGTYLFFNMHHIIGDGWSLEIVSKELMEIYNAIVNGQAPNLTPLTVHYKDYANWQNQLLESPELKAQKEYWEEKLSGEIPYIQLPADFTPKAKTAESRSAFYTVYLNAEIQESIKKLISQYKVSAFSVFAAALKVLINRLTATKDIAIGIPAANRNHYQLKDMIGCFLNTLMLRDTIETSASFESFLQEVNDTLTEALSNQNYPFEYVLEGLKVQKERDRFPISPIFLNMLDFEANSQAVIEDFTPKSGTVHTPPKFDFECYLKSYANGFLMNCVYNDELFTQETIVRWMEAYTSIISQVVENTTIHINKLSLFETFTEKVTEERPTNEFEVFTKEAVAQTIVKRFEAQVEKYPTKIAVHAKGKNTTYQQLNNNANTLAKAILEKNTANAVGLLLTHDESCVTGMLATLKSGNTYVPIDVNNPASRIQFILSDARCNVLVCNDATLDKAVEIQKQVPNLCVINSATIDTKTETPNLNLSIDPFSEAYILYTSGSTGKPKGVIQNHRNVLHYIRVYTNNVRISKEDNLSVLSTYTFDASVKDIYGAILNGATVSMFAVALEGLESLADWLQTQNVTIIHMVPTVYRYFMRSLGESVLSTVRLIDLGGEACYSSDIELFKKHFSKDAFLVNDYGPTEATIVSQKFISHNTEITTKNTPLGASVAETEVFLLDENNQKLGVYGIGEIIFKSKYLSLGYLNRDELTQKVFITDDEGNRMYRSGDIGRMLPNGEIEFLQRKDTQVKLNGVRIELSEIEYQLEKIPAIEKAIVLLRTLNENMHITGYIQKETEISNEEINKILKESLPAYMLPSVFIEVVEFPFTRTGKIDRKALPALSSSDVKATAYVAPSTEVEEKLVALWAETLQLKEKTIGVEDNFFELGGNSLQAVILINKINKFFETFLTIEYLYDTLTVSALAELIEFSIQQKHMDIINQDVDQDEFIL